MKRRAPVLSACLLAPLPSCRPWRPYFFMEVRPSRDEATVVASATSRCTRVCNGSDMAGARKKRSEKGRG